MLVVEDGTGLPNAESYASADEADAYLAARNIPTWAGGDANAKEAALRKATAYMLNYTFRGQRVSASQALDWPRYGVFADGFALPQDSVPLEVKQACIELAYRASKAELQADLGQQVTQKVVGPVSITYAAGSTASKHYAAVTALLSRYLAGSGGIRLVRA